VTARSEANPAVHKNLEPSDEVDFLSAGPKLNGERLAQDTGKQRTCRNVPQLYQAVIVDVDGGEMEAVMDCIERDPEISLVARLRSHDDAVEEVRSGRADVLVVDASADPAAALDVLKECADSLPATIVMADRRDLAVPAFDTQACDYLLKPAKSARILRALRRAKMEVTHRRLARLAGQVAQVAENLQEPGEEGIPAYPDELQIKVRRRLVSVAVGEIVSIQGAGQYCRIRTVRGEFMLSRPLASMEQQLDPSRFFRIHRSAIVNGDFVRDVVTNGDGRYRIELEGGQRYALGRSRRALLGELLARAGSSGPRLAR